MSQVIEVNNQLCSPTIPASTGSASGPCVCPRRGSEARPATRRLAARPAPRRGARRQPHRHGRVLPERRRYRSRKRVDPHGPLPYPPSWCSPPRWGLSSAPTACQLPASGLRAAVEENLQTLGVDRLDLVYLRIGRMEVRTASPSPGASSLAALREGADPPSRPEQRRPCSTRRGKRDCPRRGRAEQLPLCQARRRGPPRRVHGPRYRLRPVLSAGRKRDRHRRRPAREDRRATRRDASADCSCVAPGHLAGDAGDPGHRLSRSP